MDRPVTGGIYLVADELISLDDGKHRSVHDSRRPFLVLSTADYNDRANWRVVLGCPISKSTRFRTELCVKLAAGDGNMPEKCWVRVPALQAIPKSDLQDLTGSVPRPKLDEVRMRVLQYLGLIDEESPF